MQEIKESKSIIEPDKSAGIKQYFYGMAVGMEKLWDKEYVSHVLRFYTFGRVPTGVCVIDQYIPKKLGISKKVLNKYNCRVFHREVWEDGTYMYRYIESKIAKKLAAPKPIEINGFRKPTKSFLKILALTT